MFCQPLRQIWSFWKVQIPLHLTETSTTFHKNNIIATVIRGGGGGSLMIWDCFTTLAPGELPVFMNNEFCSLPKDPKGIISCPEDQRHLSYDRAIIGNSKSDWPSHCLDFDALIWLWTSPSCLSTFCSNSLKRGPKLLYGDIKESFPVIINAWLHFLLPMKSSVKHAFCIYGLSIKMCLRIWNMQVRLKKNDKGSKYCFHVAHHKAFIWLFVFHPYYSTKADDWAFYTRLCLDDVYLPDSVNVT